MTPPWLRAILTLLRRGRWPTAHRRAIWRSRYAFEQALATLGPGDVVIDGGANVGGYTAKLAATGAQVYAFEIDPFCVDLLRRRFADAPNVEIVAKALGGAAGMVTIHRAPDFDEDPAKKSKSTSILAEKTNVAATGIEVEQIDLADFVLGLPRVALLKLDIEGAEAAALERLLDTGAVDRIGLLFAETHEGKIPEIAPRMAEIRRRLEAGGYGRFNLDWA